MFQDALDAVRAQVSGCSTVAFADLSTRMVLLTNQDTGVSRDALNVLARQAQLCLAQGDTAMIGHGETLHVFCRSEAEPNDALLCICELDTDVDALMACMSTCLTQISDGAA